MFLKPPPIRAAVRVSALSPPRTITLPPEKSDSAAINILCPDAAFRTPLATAYGGSLRSGDMPRHFTVSHLTERSNNATTRIPTVGQVDASEGDRQVPKLVPELLIFLAANRLH